MTTTVARSKQKTEPEKSQKKKPVSVLGVIPWGLVLLAAVPVGLLVYYMILEAPSSADSLAGVDVPFPLAVEYLGKASKWCEKNPLETVLIALGVLVVGILPFVPTRRYYIALTVVASLAFLFTCYSISAPVDRLLNRVRNNLPEERKVPDYLPGEKGR